MGLLDPPVSLAKEEMLDRQGLRDQEGMWDHRDREEIWDLKVCRAPMVLLDNLEAREQMVQPVDQVTSVLPDHRDLAGTPAVQGHLGKEETLEFQVHQEQMEHRDHLVHLGTRVRLVQPDQVDCKVQQVERVKQEILGLRVTLEMLDPRVREEIPASKVLRGLLALEGPQVHLEA